MKKKTRILFPIYFMALRNLCDRMFISFARNCNHTPGSLSSWLTSSYRIRSRNVSGTRGLQAGIINTCESVSDDENGSAKETSGTLPEIMEHHIDSESSTGLDMKRTRPIVQSNSVDLSAASEMKISQRHNLAMVYTCKVCETRSVKTMSRESYEKGIVIVRCGGCNNLHLIADRLGWFGEPSSVEDFLRARGEQIRKGVQDSYELTLEDLAGWKPK